MHSRYRTPLSLLCLTGACAVLLVVPVRQSRACAGEGYLSLAQLQAACGVPGSCGSALACEGRSARVFGSVDYNNVFEHSRYPGLPYEKFLLLGEGGARVEVFAVARDNAELFRKLAGARHRGGRAYLTATPRGIDLPVMGGCRRELKLEISSPQQIRFK